jgi:hypothetical protein
MNKSDRKKLLAVMLLTDGMLTKTKSPRIMFFSNDETLMNLFRNLIEKIYNTTPTSFFKYKNGYRVIYARKEHIKIMDDLLTLSPSYKTSPNNLSVEDYNNLPQPSLSFMNNCDKELLNRAINIAMAAEGSICVTRRENGTIRGILRFACGHPTLVKYWQKLFQRAGIKLDIDTYYKVWSGISGLRIVDSSEIEKFYKIGGFLDNVKICRGKRFKGISKNKVLEAFINFKKRRIIRYYKLDDNEFWSIFKESWGTEAHLNGNTLFNDRNGQTGRT